MNAVTTEAVTRPAPRAQTAAPVAADPNAWPVGLKLILFVLVAFAVNIAAVLYLAGQMPR